MTATIDSGAQRGMLALVLTGAVSAANAGLGSIANPEGVTLGITRAFIHFATGSVGAANLSVGITTVAASASDVISAQDVIEATVGGKLIYGPTAQVAKTENPTALWTSGKFLTFTGSASTVGLAGTVFIEYIRVTD